MGALVKQYVQLFKHEEVDLQVTDDALDAIAQEVIVRETGARGLRAILENLMLDTMFELPSQEGVQKCIVTKDSVIEGRKKKEKEKEEKRENEEKQKTM